MPLLLESQSIEIGIPEPGLRFCLLHHIYPHSGGINERESTLTPRLVPEPVRDLEAVLRTRAAGRTSDIPRVCR